MLLCEYTLVMQILPFIVAALISGHTDHRAILSNPAGVEVSCRAVAQDRLRSVVFLLAYDECVHDARAAGFK